MTDDGEKLWKNLLSSNIFWGSALFSETVKKLTVNGYRVVLAKILNPLLLELLLVGEAYGATHIHGLFGLVNNFGIIGSEGLPASGFLGFCLTEAHVVNHGIIALSHDHLVNLDIGAELLAELRNQILFGKPGVAEVADGGIGERVGNGRNHIALVAGSVPAEFVAVGAEVGFACLKWIGIAWLAVSAIPFIALLARTFNGAEAQPRHPKFLGIDSLTVLSALLFFIFGVLLMYTTLHSETLHAPAGTPEDDGKVPTDTVYEEALFTYQNPVIDTATTVADTMTDLSDPDLVTPDESFDPTIEPDPSNPAPQDTVNYF